MKKILCALLLACAFAIQAQDEDRNNLEGNYLSFQVNELVRQVLSLGNTNIPSNPYFFNYRYTGPTGDGLNIGFAYTVDNFDTSDQFSDISTDISNFSFRIGYDKKKYLGKNFVYGLGIDLTIDNRKNETVNSDSFSSNEIITTDKLSGWGLGPRFTFSYQVSNRIWIGTEANYYFKSLKNSFEVEFSNDPGFDDNDRENKIRELTFSTPSILWLTIRL